MSTNRRVPFLLLFAAGVVVSGCGGGGGEASDGSGSTNPLPTPTIDSAPPVITLNGAPTVRHEQGTSYTDPGASAVDDVDGTVAVTVSGAVGVEAGSYELTFRIYDAQIRGRRSSNWRARRRCRWLPATPSSMPGQRLLISLTDSFQ